VVDDPRKLKPGRFWPDQMFMDGAASLAVLFIVVALALIVPPFLDAKADPTNGAFIPYPAWYFLWLFGLLNFVPFLFSHLPFLSGQANAPWVELLAAIVIPTILLVLLLGLPWLDRATTRAFRSRGPILWATFISFAVIIALTFYAQSGIQAKEAAGPPSQTESQILAAQPAEAASTTAAASEAGSGSGGNATDTSAHGAQVFSQNCTSCHGTNGQGQPGIAPPLAGNSFVTGPPKPVIGVLLNGLHGETIMGQSYGAQMPAWKGTLSNSDIAAVVTYIRGALGSNKASAVTAADIK
jgi:mono/diheme cytochrome c family protein